ncbi:hypothetical protein Ancab_031763 [Ancistrocladus abbreviatus]
MESSRPAKERVMIKPLMLEAGFAIAVSVVGYVCAKIMSKRGSGHPNPAASLGKDCEECSAADTQNGDRCHDFQEEFLVLRDQLEDLQKREWESETRFLQYQEIKERESKALEIMNELLLEKRHAEFLAREISLWEEQRGLMMEYLRVLKLLEALRKENGLLRRKARKLLRRAREGLRVIEEQKSNIDARDEEIARNQRELEERAGAIQELLSVVKEQKLSIEAKDEEIVRNQREIESRGYAIQELQNEIGLLKSGLNQLQIEKIELLNKIEVAETLASSRQKVEDNSIVKEDYDKLVKQLEQLQKDAAAEVKELIHLRWINACLRHELMRCNEKHEQILTETNDPLEMELEGINNDPRNSDDCDGPCSASNDSCLLKAHPKRRKFIKKLRKWVEGGKVVDKEKKEIKHFGRDFVADEAEEDHYVRGSK